VLKDDAGLLAVFSVMAGEQHLMVVMEDLIAGLWSQDHKVINCARSVEAIRQLVAGYSLAPKQQWPIFNEKLNLDRNYVDLIMEHSKDPRHGKRPSSSPHEVAEIMKRTWIIFNRYFEYKLRGEQKLALPWHFFATVSVLRFPNRLFADSWRVGFTEADSLWAPH
jgi:hypothetical protein